MTVRELVEMLIHNYDLDDEVCYDPANAIDNIDGIPESEKDKFYIDVIEERDGYVWLSEALGRR